MRRFQLVHGHRREGAVLNLAGGLNAEGRRFRWLHGSAELLLPCPPSRRPAWRSPRARRLFAADPVYRHGTQAGHGVPFKHLHP